MKKFFYKKQKMGAKQSHIKVMKELDLEKYLGKWYEVARYEQWYEEGCLDVTAEYTRLDDSNIAVVNICKGKNPRHICGTARVRKNAQYQSQLEVKFGVMPGFWGEYNVLWTNYKIAFVAGKDYNSFWILSRTSKPSKNNICKYFNELIEDIGEENININNLVWNNGHKLCDDRK